jgi:phosphoenolpyruvate carboxylase
VLNVLQVEALRRMREGDMLRLSEGNILKDESQAITEDALLVTINGIAAGMRNSG